MHINAMKYTIESQTPLDATYDAAWLWPKIPTIDETLMMLPLVLRKCGRLSFDR